jgi:hypothetical protein
MAGMKMPEWYDEAKAKMADVLAEPPPPMPAPLEMEKVTDLPYLFAEYSVKEGDVLLHLFPRAGPEDQWTDGHYINRCRNCRTMVEFPSDPRVMKPCPRCRNTGLIYVPGRSEEASKVVWSPNVRDLIKQAVDTVWMGDVAVELVEELKAYVVQIQGAKTTAKTVGLEKFVRQVCDALNSLLLPN